MALWEVMHAVRTIGKDKALSTDGLSDIIFKKKTWIKIGKEL